MEHPVLSDIDSNTGKIADCCQQTDLAGIPEEMDFLQPHGGHVGFIEGRIPWRTGSFINRLALSFFREQLAGPGA